jgi:hypothetical protein
MRSGWPHTQSDHGRHPGDQRRRPFGPDISWPTGYSDLEYREGDYHYPAPTAAQPVLQGEHPYAAFSAAGYGDDGYLDPGYDGPAAQDLGYPQRRHPQAIESGNGYSRPDYPARDYYQDPRAHQQRDYDQPPRYADEGPAYPAQDDYGLPAGYGLRDDYQDRGGYGSGAYHAAPVYDPADYNGSAYSRPGIDGPGYDLSGIIGTGDFESFGYDEPSYDRLSYDDPRYDDGHRDGPGGGPRLDETRTDLRALGGTRFDETRLDSLWLSDEDIRPGDVMGYGSDGFEGEGRGRSGYPGWGASHSGRFDETRLDLGDPRMDHTRFDVPVYDETRMDMRALPAAGGVLAPPEDRPLDWAEEPSFDDYDGLELYEEPSAPAAFVRTAPRPDGTTPRRATGRRRGRSGDRRQWMALGAIAVVAAGAIGGVLMKYVFSGPSGPAHTVVAPNQADGFTRSQNMEKQLKVDSLAQTIMKDSSGHVSNPVSAVYGQGNVMSGANPQIFEFVGGKLSGTSPSASVASFIHDNPGAKVVPAGSMGGEAVCAPEQLNGESVAMCVWFDNDSFGALVSPTMTTAKLATTMAQVRPGLEVMAR